MPVSHCHWGHSNLSQPLTQWFERNMLKRVTQGRKGKGTQIFGYHTQLAVYTTSIFCGPVAEGSVLITDLRGLVGGSFNNRLSGPYVSQRPARTSAATTSLTFMAMRRIRNRPSRRKYICANLRTLPFGREVTSNARSLPLTYCIWPRQ